jgi:hypothetical protein
LKRQRDREYYARHKDEIQKRRREAREKKQASATLLTDEQTLPNTTLAVSTPLQDISNIPNISHTLNGLCTPLQDISSTLYSGNDYQILCLLIGNATHAIFYLSY